MYVNCKINVSHINSGKGGLHPLSCMLLCFHSQHWFRRSIVLVTLQVITGIMFSIQRGPSKPDCLTCISYTFHTHFFENYYCSLYSLICIPCWTYAIDYCSLLLSFHLFLTHWKVPLKWIWYLYIGMVVIMTVGYFFAKFWSTSHIPKTKRNWSNVSFFTSL
jgi:hypothetical protein